MKLQVKFSDISEDIDVELRDNSRDIPVKFENLQRVTEYIGGDVYWGDVLDKPFETLEDVKEAVLEDIPDIPEVPTKLSELENDAGFITADDIPESGGCTVSWDDIEDKPFSEIPPLFDIQWDGNMDGHDTVELGEGDHLVKVSDDVYTAEQVVGSTIYYNDGYTDVFSEDDIYTDTGVLIMGDVFIFYSVTDIPDEAGAIKDLVSNGVWFVNTVSEGYYVNRFVAPHGIQTIDEKYIPDTIARKSDIPTIPSTDELVDSVIASLPIYNGEVEEV